MSLDNRDIWGEILVRLPAESLIRSRAVCKGWRAVIDDPCFVRAHTNNLEQQQLSSSNIIIQKTSHLSGVGFCYSLDLEALKSCSNGHQAIAAVPLDLTVDGLNDGFFSSTCNGLVLTKEYSGFTMWNPLTHERLDLPPPTRDFPTYASAAFGLGYDSTADDYKAVVILERSRETHVFSLKSDSWRRIINCPRDCDWSNRAGLFVCGALNWLSKKKEGAEDDWFVALNLGTEKYSLLQMPLLTWGSKWLYVLGGCLAVCDSVHDSHLDVWVMKDYGNEDSWFKLFSVDQRPNQNNNISVWRGLLRPAAFFMNEKLVFLQDTFEGFFLFDVDTKSFKRVGINGSIVKKGSNLDVKQMFVGTIFRLHANCGVNGGGVRKRRCTKNTKKKKKKALELVFCIRDANGMYNVPCSERGCRLSREYKDLKDNILFSLFGE